ncbi:CACTA en-spm transposon protein [Cucumis melo var. makuwa]|uniref:CACTA en-spm transposon protein n=1 Tax=Cucumis melo var. makuwa TaxID=1194695 RepID=A0A5D3C8X4_CUCMM|nr:CACTA en-spm transposon protein [Cucumis melo var. makuwa]TYK07628.1 CACTA en-spm transposon protein [Cucumis melo var. makuwa]
MEMHEKDKFLHVTAHTRSKISWWRNHVYLQPLIKELKELWTFGVHTYDSLTGQFFQLHVALLWTINDFPAYGDLSGWSTKGYQACPICMDDRSSFGIRGRISFMGHRRYLLENHVWHRSRLHDGKIERSSSQPPVTPTPKRHTQSRLLELEPYVAANGRIPMTIAPSEEKPISPHAICFSQTIGVCMQKTFPVRCLKWTDVSREYIEVVNGDL